MRRWRTSKTFNVVVLKVEQKAETQLKEGAKKHELIRHEYAQTAVRKGSC